MARAARILRETDFDGNAQGCLLWPKHIDKGGYGRIALRDKDKRTRHFKVHRLTWEVNNGPVPPDMCVCHRCDNRSCCNPTHLFLGTHAENARDRAEKGRGRHGERINKPMVTTLIRAGFSSKEIAKEMKIDLRSVERTKAALRELDEVWPMASGADQAGTRGDG